MPCGVEKTAGPPKASAVESKLVALVTALNRFVQLFVLGGGGLEGGGGLLGAAGTYFEFSFKKQRQRENRFNINEKILMAEE